MQWAGIRMNDDFISAEPLSGHGLIRRDDNIYTIYLEPNSSEETLGRALLEVLDRSRFVDPDKERDFFSADKHVAVEKLWHDDVMRRFRYKTKRQLYKNMRYCFIERTQGRISLRPHQRRPQPGGIKLLPEDQTVVIPDTRDPLVAGAALALALSRCKTF